MFLTVYLIKCFCRVVNMFLQRWKTFGEFVENLSKANLRVLSIINSPQNSKSINFSGVYNIIPLAKYSILYFLYYLLYLDMNIFKFVLKAYGTKQYTSLSIATIYYIKLLNNINIPKFLYYTVCSRIDFGIVVNLLQSRPA